MKKQFLLLCFFSFFMVVSASSQSTKSYIYYLDAKLNSVDKSRAVIIGEGRYNNGLLRLDCYSLGRDKLYVTLHCTDSTLAELDGLYTSYHDNGKQEEEGNYKYGNKVSTWQKWDSLGRKTDSAYYEMDNAILSATFSYNEKGALSYCTLKDSLQDTYRTFSYNDDKLATSEVYFKGQNGILKNFFQ